MRTHSENPADSSFLIEPLERRSLLSGTIKGVIFDDLNGNGVRETGEPGLANQTIYLDVNFDGTFNKNEPSVKSGADGSYTFAARPNGIQRVRYDPPTGRRLTAPSAIFRDVPVANNTTSNVNFGSTTNAVAVGYVFSDTNGNGRKDVGELGLAGWTVFLDRNNNNKPDSNEKVRVTNSAGYFRFTNLPAGTYTLKIVQQAGFVRTNPLNGLFKFTLASGKSISNRNFGELEQDPGGTRP